MKFEGPIIYTNDLKKSIYFYETILGLKLDRVDNGQFASMRLENGCRLGIKKKSEIREIPGAQTITFIEDDIDNLYQKMINSDVRIISKLTDYSWGRNFIITDPDGNFVEFTKR